MTKRHQLQLTHGLVRKLVGREDDRGGSLSSTSKDLQLQFADLISRHNMLIVTFGFGSKDTAELNCSIKILKFGYIGGHSWEV
jgi:hypothetical protein